jgi:hypothetical protein
MQNHKELTVRALTCTPLGCIISRHFRFQLKNFCIDIQCPDSVSHYLLNHTIFRSTVRVLPFDAPCLKQQKSDVKKARLNESCFTNQEFCISPTECIYQFRMILPVNSIYFLNLKGSHLKFSATYRIFVS